MNAVLLQPRYELDSAETPDNRTSWSINQDCFTTGVGKIALLISCYIFYCLFVTTTRKNEYRTAIIQTGLLEIITNLYLTMYASVEHLLQQAQ